MLGPSRNLDVDHFDFLHGAIEYIQELPLGIFVMELKGDQADVSQAIHYLEQREAIVEVMEHGN